MRHTTARLVTDTQQVAFDGRRIDANRSSGEHR